MVEKVEISLLCGAETEHLSLRKGLNLQCLEGKTKTLEFDCRKADCGICIVRVKEGQAFLSPPNPTEADFLRAMRADPDERLACQCRVFGSVTLEVDAPLIP